MSSRAIRSLRGEDALAIPKINLPDALAEDKEEEEEGDDDDDYHRSQRHARPRFYAQAFAAFDDDDDDDDDDGTKNEGSSTVEEIVDNEEEQNINYSKNNNSNNRVQKEALKQQTIAQVENKEVEEEDIDALLSEFGVSSSSSSRHQQDQHINAAPVGTGDTTFPSFDFILQGWDVRDLDYDYTMRTCLLLNKKKNQSSTNMTTSGHKKRSSATTLLFGTPLSDWNGVRPPRLVSGGMGMKKYSHHDDANSLSSIPWPYNRKLSSAQEIGFGTFLRSEDAQRDVNDYYRVVQNSGSIESLILFVAHHPFCTPALLQLSTVMYQTNHNAEGYQLLRRVLWIYECAAASIGWSSRLQEGKVDIIVDKNQPENADFFQALSQLMKISNIAGLNRTAFAVTRLLLSMDSLRDPMGVLLVLDNYALKVATGTMCEIERNRLLKWIIDLVENKYVQLWFRYDDENEYNGDLRNMPNWAYSYALSLFLSHKWSYFEDKAEIENSRKKADDALREAMIKFPTLVGLLLQNLEIDTTGRSFQRDWITVLDFITDHARRLVREWRNEKSNDPAVLSATTHACDLIMQVFVRNCVDTWRDDDVLQWLFENLKELKNSSLEQDTAPLAPNPAVMRYLNVDLSDFENKIQLLPEDANVVNAGLIGHALVIHLNRPRFVRQMQQRGGDPNDMNEFALGENNMFLPRRALLGPPTEIIDPDWPVLEVFWRSFLPWTHVEGVPPPRR